MEQYKMLIDGDWLGGKEKIEVENPFNRKVFAAVPKATDDDVNKAIEAAQRAFKTFRKTTARERSLILEKTSAAFAANRQSLADTITTESGKAAKFALGEVDRATQTFKFAAEEAKRIAGKIIPLDAAPKGENRFGFFFREPIGIVGAITPFNFPLNLVAHKVAPAIACGNTVILKPASTTPITSLKMAELLIEAGLPKGVLNVIFGSGAAIGPKLVTDERIAMITFTGSPPVGREIKNSAGLKKVTLELGSNSAVIVDKKLDYQKHLPRFLLGCFAYSGQVCISVQRIYVRKEFYEQFVSEFVSAVNNNVKVGDPSDPDVDMGPMITEKEAQRIEAWVNEAKDNGAKIHCGGKREGNIYYPTVITDADPQAKILREEAFAPVVTIIPYDTFEQAIDLVNDSKYGLQAGVYTDDVNKPFKAVAELDVGGVMINDIPTFRVDHMPYGGNKKSGVGREGPHFAVEEMTNIKMVCYKID